MMALSGWYTGGRRRRRRRERGKEKGEEGQKEFYEDELAAESIYKTTSHIVHDTN